MPRTKKEAPKASSKKKSTTARTTRGQQKKTTNRFDFKQVTSSIRNNFQANRKLYTRYSLITLLVILIAVFVYLKKDWFVVAMVNNQPITSVELYNTLKAQDGQAVLDQIIRDRLISQEADKKGVSVSSKEIDDKIASVQKQLGGKEGLDSALAQRNLSMSDFQNQIKIQLLVEKLLSKDIQVSDKEIDDYIAKNPDQTKGQSRDDIRTQLKNTKLNDKFQSWYQDLQKNAHIIKFI